METPNANIVCKKFFSLFTVCENCPIKKECASNPKNPDMPTDWEERIENAATKYLKGNELK